MFVNARNGFASENARRFRSCKRKMNNKRNVVLYLDKDLAEKTRELGFNLPNTFENHLKQLITQFSNVNLVDDSDSWSGFSSPGEIRTLVGGSKARYAWPLHHRASRTMFPS
jgi:hypothetical protein